MSKFLLIAGLIGVVCAQDYSWTIFEGSCTYGSDPQLVTSTGYSGECIDFIQPTQGVQIYNYYWGSNVQLFEGVGCLGEVVQYYVGDQVWPVGCIPGGPWYSMKNWAA
jgi:hypothetical protein